MMEPRVDSVFVITLTARRVRQNVRTEALSRMEVDQVKLINSSSVQIFVFIHPYKHAIFIIFIHL